MKWLVQTLDSLLPLHSESSNKEQEKLQSLMERYTSLLPTIEVTVTRMESSSKYYVFRKQLIEVSKNGFLKRF